MIRTYANTNTHSTQRPDGTQTSYNKATGHLEITGSNRNDKIEVNQVYEGRPSKAFVQVKVNGTVAEMIPAKSVKQISVDTKGGSDRILVSSAITIPTILNGGSGDDTIYGGSGHNMMDGGFGNDVLVGGRKADVILGGYGNDNIRGGRGNDEIVGGAGDDSMYGGIGNDYMVDGRGDNMISGGSGFDHVEGDLDIDQLAGGASFENLNDELMFDRVFIKA